MTDLTAPAADQALLCFDLLLRDAIFLTADPAQPECRGWCLGISGQRITWFAPDLPTRYSAKRELRLPGHFVTPGFVNPWAKSTS